MAEELQILSNLPECQRQTVFELAEKQTHCQNIQEWLNYLQIYVDDYIRSNEVL